MANGQKITNEQLQKAVKLKTIGYLGSTKNHINLSICTEMGMVVFDSVKSNLSNKNLIARRMADFINSGTTYRSTNFPNLRLPKIAESHRLIHIHQNVPGIMAKITKVLAKHEINIVGQFLMTNPQIGYVITDIDTTYDKMLLKELRKIEKTIKFRVLY